MVWVCLEQRADWPEPFGCEIILSPYPVPPRRLAPKHPSYPGRVGPAPPLTRVSGSTGRDRGTSESSKSHGPGRACLRNPARAVDRWRGAVPALPVYPLHAPAGHRIRRDAKAALLDRPARLAGVSKIETTAITRGVECITS